MMAAQKLLDVDNNVYSLFLLLNYWTSKYHRRNKDENLGDKKRMQFFWRQRDHQMNKNQIIKFFFFFSKTELKINALLTQK